MSFHLSAGTAGYLSSYNRWDRPHIKVRGESRDSSRVEAGESTHTYLEMKWGTRGYSRVVAGTLGFLLNCDGYLEEPLVLYATAAAVKLLRSCPTLCDSIDGTPPGSPFPGILQERTLECIIKNVLDPRHEAVG